MSHADSQTQAAYNEMRTQWSFPEGVTNLNHGSFGASPMIVRQNKQEWSHLLESNPMDFFVRELENHLDHAAEKLGKFVGAPAKDLIFVGNATDGMNILATSLEFESGDEILFSDHEYGAVVRIWRRVCKKTGAIPVFAQTPCPVTSTDEFVDAIFEKATDRTKLLVVSHISSPTAVVFPVAEICRRAKERKIPVCIDGPHAIAMLPLNIQELNCDFYTASCHKWLCAPFGSGFLYVAPKWQQKMQPAVLSWGRSVSGRQTNWKDEFHWTGTHDPSANLAIPAAIEFLTDYGLENFRKVTHQNAQYFRQRMQETTGLPELVPDSPDWYGSMIAMPIPNHDVEPPPNGKRDPLQDALWEKYKIEIPVLHWQGQRLIRCSCHLYNSRTEIDLLMQALKELPGAITTPWPQERES